MTVDAENEVTVPVVAEELKVATHTIETGRVVLRKSIHEQETTVDPALVRTDVIVKRVAINRLCEGPPPGIRQEGEVMIVPVLEEVLVVEKRLLLKEEVHIRQEQTTFHAPQHVAVRREEVFVERVPASSSPEGLEAAPA